MPLFLIGVLEEFVRDRSRMDTTGHVVVPLVAQHAYYLGRERGIEDTDGGRGIAAIIGGDGSGLAVLARTFAQCFHVGEMRLVHCRSWTFGSAVAWDHC